MWISGRRAENDSAERPARSTLLNALRGDLPNDRRGLDRRRHRDRNRIRGHAHDRRAHTKKANTNNQWMTKERK